MLSIIRALIPKRFETKLIPGLLLQLILSATAMIPAWWIMYQEYGNTQAVLWTAGLLWLINIMSATVLSASLTIQQNQIKYEQTLTQYTEELQKEVALFEQKLSIEKRTWSRIIHGEVQAALTAAVTRLQRTETLEPYQLEMVKQDLARAKDNLINPPKPQANFNQSLSEITSTWRSICTIQTDISARAQRAVDQNQDVCIVTNEIIKEAVSNAVRHGQAKTVNIKLDRIKDDILEIEISNDGYKPLRDQTPGLGSQLLDELTLSWQLNTNKNLTTLKATVPISKN
jgi:two-component sensor histidine kinase